MISKTRTALIAAFVLGSASAAFAQSDEQFESSQYLRDPSAPVAVYQEPAVAYAQEVVVQRAPALIEGRNVAQSWNDVAQSWNDRGQDPLDRSIDLTF